MGTVIFRYQREKNELARRIGIVKGKAAVRLIVGRGRGAGTCCQELERKGRGRAGLSWP